MSKPSLSYSANGWPIGWNGCSTRWIAPFSHAFVARIRCRNVWANVHSPSTDTSTVPGGIAATRSSVAAHVRSSAAHASCRAGWVGRLAQLATGEPPIELGLDERDHVDTVDAEFDSTSESGVVDVGTRERRRRA